MKKVLLFFVQIIIGAGMMLYGILGLDGYFWLGTRPEIFVLMLIFGAMLLVLSITDTPFKKGKNKK